MADAYVTLNEAAELEGTTYATMQRRVHRNPEKFLIDKEQRETGGKEMIMVAISSLSKKARTAWKEREKLKTVAEAPIQEADQAGETPWYVEEDIDWYIENRKEDWYKAMELGNIVREFLEYDERGRTEFAETFAQERLGKGKRTLYRYTKAYQEASAWADKMHKQDGGNYDFFKVLCLCRKPKEAGTFPSFTPEVKQVIKNIWFNKEFAQNQGTREMLYEKLQAIANINNWEKIPSYQSVARYISHLMNDEGMRNAWYLASRGEREYKNKVMVKGERNTKDLQVMQVVMGDEHTFDCWVAYTHPNGKVTAIKPHLVAWVDIKSRSSAGEATETLLRKVEQAVEYLKGNYDDFLCRSATIVRQDIDLTIYLSKDVSTSGVKEQAEYIIENTLKLTDREDMNCLYLDSIRVALAGGISDYRKSVISKPNNDIELNKGNVILLGNLNVQVTNVGGGESGL